MFCVATPAQGAEREVYLHLPLRHPAPSFLTVSTRAPPLTSASEFPLFSISEYLCRDNSLHMLEFSSPFNY